MSPLSNDTLDAARNDALDRIDRVGRRVKLLVVLAAVVEAVAIGAYLILMDFGDTTHWLILIGVAFLYVNLSIGLMALGAHLDESGQRTLKALEALAIDKDPAPPDG